MSIFLLCFYFNHELLFSELLNLLIIIDFILIGGVLPLIERKYLSLIQRRVGPKYAGYKGRLQFIADALKVFFKDYFFLNKINRSMFYILPILFFNFNLFFCINIIWARNLFLFDIEINILYILILSAVSNFFVFIVGFFCRNKYTLIASTRVINIFFVNELLFSIIICQYLFIANNFSFSGYLYCVDNYVGLYFLFFYLPIIIFIYLLDINRVPFDYTECESEIITGYNNEYTGFLFGVFVLVEYIHIFFFSYFLIVLFF